MTKQEAIKAMREGKKVTHRYFAADEWITIIGGKIFTEDGCSCSQEEFWHYRLTPSFEEDWELFTS